MASFIQRGGGSSVGSSVCAGKGCTDQVPASRSSQFTKRDWPIPRQTNNHLWRKTKSIQWRKLFSFSLYTESKKNGLSEWKPLTKLIAVPSYPKVGGGLGNKAGWSADAEDLRQEGNWGLKGAAGQHGWSMKETEKGLRTQLKEWAGARPQSRRRTRNVFRFYCQCNEKP